MALFSILILALFCCCLIKLYYWHIFGYWQRKGVDLVEEPVTILGHFWVFINGKKPVIMVWSDWYKKVKGPYAGVYFFSKPALLMKDPDIIKSILVKDFNSFCDRGVYVDEKREPLSGYLFRLQGNKWRNTRSKLTSSFAVGKLKMMFETLTKSAEQWENSMDAIQDNTFILQISDQATRYSSDIIASVIFGLQTNCFLTDGYWWLLCKQFLNTNFIRYFVLAFVSWAPQIWNLFRLPSIPKRLNLEIFGIVKEVVDYRQKNDVQRNDFMQLLIQLKQKETPVHSDETSNNVNDGLSIYEISAAAFSMFFAGFETSSKTIQCCLYELARNPKYQALVQKDIDQCLAEYNGQITYQSIMNMLYLNKVINETLRMYPGLGVITRSAVHDYKLPDSNLTIEKDTQIIISLNALQRDPEHFPDPDTFNPERFSLENKSNIRSSTFIPFGDGPRNCIGKKLGYLITAVGLVTVLKNRSVSISNPSWDIQDLNPYCLNYEYKTPLFLKVTKRNDK